MRVGIVMDFRLRGSSSTGVAAREVVWSHPLFIKWSGSGPAGPSADPVRNDAPDLLRNSRGSWDERASGRALPLHEVGRDRRTPAERLSG